MGEREVEMTPVKSSNLAAVGYDATSKTLYVRFHNGSVYRYHEVPESVFEDLLGAESAGSYFHANVRNEFRTSKV